MILFVHTNGSTCYAKRLKTSGRQM